MVIGVHGLLGAHLPAQHFNGAVGNNFIGIHVRLRARTGLPDNKREVVIERAIGNFCRRFHNRFAGFGVQIVKLHIGLGCCHFDDAQRANKR